MRPAWIAALLTPFVLAASGCLADPSHAGQADELRAELGAMPGVASVSLDYAEPATLDSGKIRLEVEMRPDAASEAIVQVVTTTYDAFSGAHRGEEGDLDVMVGEDTIHLRSFEPAADTEAVARAATAANSVLGSGTVRAEIVTQDVASDPHVETTYFVDVKDPGRAPLLDELERLRAAHSDIPYAAWSVSSGGEFGWLLRSAGAGFPDADQLALFDRLGAQLPRGAAIQMYDSDFVVAQVPADAAPAQVSGMVGRHLQLLGGATNVFYNVESGPDFSMMIADGECTFNTNAIGASLEQDFGASCLRVEKKS